jgi:hypothetical protein
MTEHPTSKYMKKPVRFAGIQRTTKQVVTIIIVCRTFHCLFLRVSDVNAIELFVCLVDEYS